MVKRLNIFYFLRQEDWDDEDVEDEFTIQLRKELKLESK